MSLFGKSDDDENGEQEDAAESPENEGQLQWYTVDAKAWIEAQVAQDPALDEMQDAMAHAAKLNLGNFEIFLAGEVAESAARHIGEREWLNPAITGDNKLVQGALRGEGIWHADSEAASNRLDLAIGTLKSHGLWPW